MCCPSPACASSGVQPHSLGRFSRKASLLEKLLEKDVRLVVPQIFIDYHEKCEILPKCQDVPPEYFLDFTSLTEERLMRFELIAISYCWSDTTHPDPCGHHLATIHALMKKFVVGTFSASTSYTSGGTVWMADGTEVFGSGDGRDVGVFFDWLSLPQDSPKGSRTAADTEVFKRALRTINVWYAHRSTIVWMLTSLPPGARREDYEGSGWTTFEKLVGGLVSPSPNLLRIDAVARENLLCHRVSGDYLQISFDLMDRARGPPVEPAVFNLVAAEKHFTNGADRDLVVVPRYLETFNVVIVDATAVKYSGMSLDDSTCRDIFAVFRAHSVLQAIEEVDVSLNEISMPVEELVTLSRGFSLRVLNCAANSLMGGQISSLVQFRNLTKLLLWRTQVTGSTSDLATLEHLRVLSFSKTQITGATSDLVKLMHLTCLRFSNTQVTGTTCDLCKLRNLTVLHFAHAPVTGTTSDLAQMGYLTQLKFGDTRVTGTTSDLVKLPRLTQLSFSNTQVTGTTSDLSLLGSLAGLRFASTQVTGMLSDLRTLDTLRELDFADTQVFENISDFTVIQ